MMRIQSKTRVAASIIGIFAGLGGGVLHVLVSFFKATSLQAES